MTDLRSSFSNDKELQELKLDLKRALKKIPKFELKEVVTPYTEPMYISHTTKPAGVLLLWGVDASDQEDPTDVLGGGFCHTTWDGVKSRIRINSIDGLTPDPTKLFRMTFMVVG